MTELARLIAALVIVESGGDASAVGDKGAARGILQIHRPYWEDACRFLEVDWPYDDALDPDKSRAVCQAYLRHYGRAFELRSGVSADFEILARIHNGGPNGWKKRATLKYWKRVKAVLKRTQP